MKLNFRLPSEAELSLLNIYPTEMVSYVHKSTCITMLMEVISSIVQT